MGQEAIAFNEDVVGLDGRTAATPVKVSSAKPMPTQLVSGGSEVDVATEATQAAILTELQSTDTINVAPDTSAIMNGSTSLTPKFAKIDLSASGDVVAAVTSKKIRVIAYKFVCSAAVTVKFQSGATTDLTGAESYAANGGSVCGFNPVGWFETASGEKLNVVLGSSQGVKGHLTYIEV